MAFQLVSHPLCPFVHRAAALLTHKSVPYTVEYIDLHAKPDWFLAISPRGKVPVLTVDGTSIFESLVILEYLDETHGPRMLPTDPLERARTRMWMHAANDVLAAQYQMMTADNLMDQAAALGAARDVLARFQEVLVGPYFTGDELGLVDIALGPALLRFEMLEQLLGLDIYAFTPRVEIWSQRLSELEAFRETLPAGFDERFRAAIPDLSAQQAAQPTAH